MMNRRTDEQLHFAYVAFRVYLAIDKSSLLTIYAYQFPTLLIISMKTEIALQLHNFYKYLSDSEGHADMAQSHLRI